MKYHSKKIECMGHRFDSKAEADYFRYLLAEKEAGNVLDIQLQPKIVLQESFKLNGKTIRQISYTPDFLVTRKIGGQVYVDVKGCSTQQGLMRYKLYKYKYEYHDGVPLVWVAQSKKYSKTGWIEYFELEKIRKNNRKQKQG